MNLIFTTGLGGFLGRHLKEVLESEQLRPENLPRYLRRSPGELRACLDARQPAAVVHMAGIVDVHYCRAQSARSRSGARHGPRHSLGRAATDRLADSLHLCRHRQEFRRATVVWPLDTLSAILPLRNIESCRRSARWSPMRSPMGLPIYLLRFPNFFWRRSDIHHPERLIPSICLAAIHKRKLVVRTQLEGSLRQYLYVQDAARIIVQTLKAVRQGSEYLEEESLRTINSQNPSELSSETFESIMGEAMEVSVLNPARGRYRCAELERSKQSELRVHRLDDGPASNSAMVQNGPASTRLTPLGRLPCAWERERGIAIGIANSYGTFQYI